MSDSEAEERKSRGVPLYHGDFPSWTPSFRAYAALTNCLPALKPPKEDKPTKDYLGLGLTNEIPGDDASTLINGPLAWHGWPSAVYAMHTNLRTT